MDIDKKYPKLSQRLRQEYYDRILINKHVLDDAAAEHPQLFYDIAERSAEAISLRDSAKKRLEDLEATLSRSVRVRTQHDKKSPTERAIADLVRKELSYQEVYDELLALKECAAKWDALRSSAETRSSMLKMLASLYVANYFTTESLKGGKEVGDLRYRSDRAKLKQARKHAT